MIDTDTFITLSFILSFGAPMAVAARELVIMRRGSRKGPDGGVLRPEPTRPLLPGDDDLPPLPPSLIPKLDPSLDPAFDGGPVRGPKVRELV